MTATGPPQSAICVVANSRSALTSDLSGRSAASRIIHCSGWDLLTCVSSEMAVTPVPARGDRRHCYYLAAQVILSFGVSLAEDTEVSAPELGVVDGTDRGADAVREPGQVVDEQLRTRLVGREAVARVGQHERVREVRVRAVDQRHVAVDGRSRRVVVVLDPDRLGGDATRLEGDALLGGRGGGNANAQAGVHAERRVLELPGRVVDAVDAAVREVPAGDAAVVQRDRGGDQAGGVEVSRGALDRRHEVLGRVGVAGAEQDDRLADLGALTQDVHDEVRGAVGAEGPAEDVDAVLTTGRGRRGGRHRAYGPDSTDEGERRRAGEQLALDGHVRSLRESTVVPCARLSEPTSAAWSQKRSGDPGVPGPGRGGLGRTGTAD